MSQVRAISSPDLVRPSTSITEQQYDDSALQGVAASIKLLLKLTQDHKDACDKEKNGTSRRMLRVATMMTILDNIRDRIQKCQSFGNKGSGPELRRWNTIPRTYNYPTTQDRGDRADNEKERLTRELSACLAAQKNLEGMCSSLGREKEIMAAELSRKVQELSGMEELTNDLKAQNETLLVKVRKCASEHNNKEKKCSGAGSTIIEELQLTTALQERNRALSDGYPSMKRKLKAAEEENEGMRATMDEMRAKVVGSLERIRSLKEHIVLPSAGENSTVDVKEEIVWLESMFECSRMLVAKHDRKQLGDCVQHKAGQIGACKPSVLA